MINEQHDSISLVIDGRDVCARVGETLIQVMDRQGIAIPRFCYHPDLSTVASCRMCLVEVDMSPKLVPSCVTVVHEGMKVLTKSEKTRQSQKDVLQLLLINHPLDCPICDQGGECDLQDLTIQYGSGSSSFCETKTAAPDLDLGPLIATHMSRCIKCSRCVRFGTEIASQTELGFLDKGDSVHIASSLKTGMSSPLSGNIIDLCPVGALTSKPAAHTGRAWTYHAYQSVAAHDCIGSQIMWHIRYPSSHTEAPTLMRVVPKTDTAINHSWLSDVDRFSYTGYQTNRLTKPSLKLDGTWVEISWEEAYDWLEKYFSALEDQGVHDALALCGPQTTMEEGYYLQMWWRKLGFRHIISDARVSDDRDQSHWSGSAGSAIAWDKLDAYEYIYILGGDILHEVPILAIRLNHAMKEGCHVTCIGDPMSALSQSEIISLKPSNWLHWLGEAHEKEDHPLHRSKGKTLMILSSDVWHHGEASSIRQWMNLWGEIDHHDWIQLTDGPNAAGLQAVGCTPLNDHMDTLLQNSQGHKMHAMKDESSPKLVWMHALDGMQDTCFPKKWLNCDTTLVAMHYYDDPFLREHATLMLPLAHLPEKQGRYMSATGNITCWDRGLTPLGDALDGSSVYVRMLGTLPNVSILEFSDWFDNVSLPPVGVYQGYMTYDTSNFTSIPMWSSVRADPLVRRARELNEAHRDQLLREETHDVERIWSMSECETLS